jgi:hypothetical protein
MAARLRPAKTSAIAREASHGQDTALRREAPPVAEDVALTVRSAISAPPSFRKLHCSGQKQPNSLIKPNWSDTPALDFVACCLRFDPATRKLAIIPLRSIGGESEKLASRWRDDAGKRDPAKCCWLCGGVGMREHLRLRCSQAARLCLRFASGTFTQHTLSVWSLMLRFHLNSFRADNSPRAGPFGAELRSDNVALCAIPPLHCHADCCRRKRHPRRHAPALVAWQSSRQLAGIPHANAAAPRVFLSLAGSGIGKLTSELIGSLRSKNNYSWFFVSAASFSSPAFSAIPLSPSVALSRARPISPANPKTVVPSEAYAHGGMAGDSPVS